MTFSRRWLACILPVFALAGCGGSSHHHTTTPTTTTTVITPVGPVGTTTTTTTTPQLGVTQVPSSALRSACPPGHATMGCSIAKPSALRKLGPTKATASGPKLVDVSSYQGCPNWRAAKPYIRGAIFKAGEDGYHQDSSLACNVAGAQRAGLGWYATYWFERGGSCVYQADRYVQIVRQFKIPGPYILDAEVPSATLTGCIAARIEQDTGWRNGVVTYTGTGTWPGGGHGNTPLWDATYGPRPWTAGLWGPMVAWQFSGDCVGPYPHSVPGVGSCIDVSLDYGLTRITKTPPRIHCFGPNRQTSRYCATIRWRVGHWQRTIIVTRRKLTASRCWRYRTHQSAPQPCRSLFAYGDALHRDIAQNLY